MYSFFAAGRFRAHRSRNRHPKLLVEAPKPGQDIRDCRILVILAGRPVGDDGYLAATQALGDDIGDFLEDLRFGKFCVVPKPHKGREDNSRGKNHKTSTFGNSFGGGQTVSNFSPLCICTPRLTVLAAAWYAEAHPTQCRGGSTF